MPEVLYKRDGWCYIVLSTHYPSSKYKREKTKKDKEIMNVKNVTRRPPIRVKSREP